ncbi:MAG: UbiA family prenyltransferase [Pseudomonadales bacterium]|nr:UbiA family prenyltransferase [Pseudomonadales bacterium]
MSDNKPAIVIDLDGTLIKSDLLIESFLLLIKSNPLYILMVPLWLLKGKAAMKKEIAVRVNVPVDTLPYNEAVLEYIREKRTQGFRTALATASNQKFASDVATHLDLFDDVYASDDHINLSGSKKRAALNEAYGEKQYIYAGNADVDTKVWQDCSAAVVVGGASLAKKAEKLCGLDHHIPKEGGLVKRWVKALRVHQWVKNGLIFVPLFASHQISNAENFLLCALAFLAFSLCASSVYLLNDLLDLNDDRQHKSKRNRPFAAGSLDLLHGLLLAPILLVAAFMIAVGVSQEFFIVLLCYYILTFAYSFFLKRIVLVDVITLAGLYTIRIIAGAAAISVVLSFWLLAFSIFVFLSLALVKRFTEVLDLRGKEGKKALGRGYHAEDIELLSSLGGSSGYISVLVLALYINSEDVKVLYGDPVIMWPICLVMLFWISRVWIMAHRGQMDDDPIVFALKDKASLLCGAIIAGFMIFAV